MNNINRSCLCDAGGFGFLVLLTAKQLDTKSISSLKKDKTLRTLRTLETLETLKTLKSLETL